MKTEEYNPYTHPHKFSAHELPIRCYESIRFDKFSREPKAIITVTITMETAKVVSWTETGNGVSVEVGCSAKDKAAKMPKRYTMAELAEARGAILLQENRVLVDYHFREGAAKLTPQQVNELAALFRSFKQS